MNKKIKKMSLVLMVIIIVMVGWDLKAGWRQRIQVNGLGHDGEGAGIAFVNLDNNSRPEMVLMTYDAPSGQNTFKYRIGWNVNKNCLATNWSKLEVDGLGHNGEGAGIAFVNLDHNPRPEMVLMAYDAPSGQNAFKYKIGWNVMTNGWTPHWTKFEINGLGHNGEGAGIAFVNLDSNPRPEMVLMAYDAPKGQNKFKYRIGWNVMTNGLPLLWSKFEVDGVGHNGDGAEIAFVNLDSNPRPEMVLMAYDAPKGQNKFRYRIGWNVTKDGQAKRWGDILEVGGVGHDGEGAGMAFADLDEDSTPEMVLMAYDAPRGQNTFKYRVGWKSATIGEKTKEEPRMIKISNTKFLFEPGAKGTVWYGYNVKGKVYHRIRTVYNREVGMKAWWIRIGYFPWQLGSIEHISDNLNGDGSISIPFGIKAELRMQNTSKEKVVVFITDSVSIALKYGIVF